MNCRSGIKCCIIMVLLLFMISVFCPEIAFATGDPLISGANISVAAGSTVEYAIRIDNNPGIASYKIYVECDKTVFSINYDETSSALSITQGDFSANGMLLSNYYLDTGWQISWFHTNDQTSDGNLVLIQFTINEDAPIGVYPITIRHSAKNTVNQNEVIVPLETVNGSITVTETPPALVSAIIGAEKIARPGQYIDYAVYVDNNPGIAAYKIFVECDTDIFSAIALDGAGYMVERGNFSASGTILCNVYGQKGWQVSWFDTKNTDANGSLFILRLFVSESAAPNTYPITIRCSDADIVDKDGVKVAFAAINGSIRLTDSDLEANGIVLYQSSSVPATVTLSDGDNEIATATTAADGSYTLTAPEGTGYTLVVTKPGYLSYTIKNLTLIDGEEIEAIDIKLLAGDVNVDGYVNSVDLTCLLSEFGRAPINYSFADIDGDGIVNSVDLTYLLAGFNKRNIIIEK